MRALQDAIDFDKIEMVSGNWKTTERKEILEHMVHCIKEAPETGQDFEGLEIERSPLRREANTRRPAEAGRGRLDGNRRMPQPGLAAVR
jgi:hypothetical protein